MTTTIDTHTDCATIAAGELYETIAAMKRSLPRAGRTATHAYETVTLHARDRLATLTTFRQLTGGTPLILRRRITCVPDAGLHSVVPLKELEAALRSLKTNLKHNASELVQLHAATDGLTVSFQGCDAYVAAAADDAINIVRYAIDTVADEPANTDTLGTVSGYQLSQAWNDVRRAVAGWYPNMSVLMLNLVNVMATEDDMLTMQSTDWFRAAHSPMSGRATGDVDQLGFPANLVDAAHRLVETNDTLTFCRHLFKQQSYVAIHGQHFDVYAYELNRPFPTVPGFANAHATVTAVFDAPTMLDQLTLLKPLTNRAGEVLLSIGDGGIDMVVGNQMPQSRNLDADVRSVASTSLAITFNIHYLVDALANHGGAVMLLATQPGRPGLFVAADDDRIGGGDAESVAHLDRPYHGRTHLLMPVRPKK